MKSIYLRNFIATAAMIGLGLLLVAVSIFLIGRSYIIEDYRANMISSAQEVAHTASAVAEKDSLNSWLLRMILSSISKATGNHIMITDSDGMVVSCCDELPICSHMGRVLPEDIVTAVNTTGGYQGRLLVSGFCCRADPRRIGGHHRLCGGQHPAAEHFLFLEDAASCHASGFRPGFCGHPDFCLCLLQAYGQAP